MINNIFSSTHLESHTPEAICTAILHNFEDTVHMLNSISDSFSWSFFTNLLYFAAWTAIIFYITPHDMQRWRLAKHLLDDNDIRKRDKNIILGTLIREEQIYHMVYWKSRENCAEGLGITVQQVSRAIETGESIHHWYLAEPATDLCRIFRTYDAVKAYEEQGRLPAEFLDPERLDRPCCRDISNDTSTPPTSPPSSPLHY